MYNMISKVGVGAGIMSKFILDAVREELNIQEDIILADRTEEFTDLV